MAFGLGGVLVALAQAARSADGPPPPTPPSATPLAGNPLTPPPPETPTIEQLAERLRSMEEASRKRIEQLESTTRDQEAQIRQLLGKVEELSGRSPDQELNGAPLEPVPPPLDDMAPADLETPIPDYTEDQFTPNAPAPGYPFSNLLDTTRLPLRGTFGPGFRLDTADEEFRLQVHLESQLEGRVWGPGDRLPPGSGISGIYLPRQRIFFDGHITRWVEYEFSINRGLNNLNLLNAFINLHLDDRFQVRVGRFFTPLPYDQYAISNYWLPTPERSLFTTNVGLNRQFGLMAWGYLLDKQVDYAAGIFNGSRNSFENANSALDFVGYFNARPFQESESLRLARFLNVGTSVAFGRQDQAPVPVAFRIAGGSPDTNIPGSATVPFLILNRDTIERGDRLIGSVHSAFFYKGLSLIGEWQYGYGSYATANRPTSTRVPIFGYYLSGGYFLTGEHVQRRSRVYPLRPLIPTKAGQDRGLGALEVAGRFSRLGLGDAIFTGGFADPALWSDTASTTEVGLNWYWNEYIKLYTFWLHGRFGDSIVDRTGRFQDAVDMFWLRFQLYY